MNKTNKKKLPKKPRPNRKQLWVATRQLRNTVQSHVMRTQALSCPSSQSPEGGDGQAGKSQEGADQGESEQIKWDYFIQPAGLFPD